MIITLDVKLNGVPTELEVDTDTIIDAILEHIPNLPKGAYYDSAERCVVYKKNVVVMDDNGCPCTTKTYTSRCTGLSGDDVQLIKGLNEISDKLNYK